MKKFYFVTLVLLSLGGCAKSTPHSIELKNSPCACNYNGEQLITSPSESDLQEIADLQLWRV